MAKTKPKFRGSLAVEPEDTRKKFPTVKLTSVKEMESIFTELNCKFVVNGRQYSVTGRRLTPAETHRTTQLMKEALPPLLPDERDGEGKLLPARYNVNDPAYLKRHAENYNRARALALWCAFPMFREGAKGTVLEDEKSEEKILEYIHSLKLDDDLLVQMFNEVCRAVVEPEDAVNFS